MTCSDATRILIAMGISKLEPCFRQSAGVRLTTIFLTGKANPAFFIAALILSRDACNAASGNPTTGERNLQWQKLVDFKTFRIN